MNFNGYDDIKIPENIDIKIHNGVQKAVFEISEAKINKKKKLTGAICATIALILALGIANPALAAKLPIIGNVFEAIEKNLFFPGNYSQYATSVNETTTSNGVDITLSEILCDGQSLYVTYIVENKDSFKYTSWGNTGKMDMNQLITEESYNKVNFSDIELGGSGFAVGGGSAIDSSKSIREFALRVDHYAEVGLIAIPTTSGTGSEVTSFAVVSDPAEQRKYPLVSWELTPDEAILDAELVKSVPAAITADTGMDVFTHALEACVSTDRSDFSTALAEKSIELVGVFLLRAYLDGNDTHARQKMHSASCLAGLAFNSASLGLNHGMAHQLGAKFHIPHGRANAMLLPHIIEFNSDINKHSKSQKEYLPAVKRYATVAQILGLSSYNEIMTVRSLVNWVQFMLKEMDIPLSISQMGTISEEEYFNAIDSMADAALEDGCTATNPRVPNKEDVIEIYKKLWK